MSEIDTSSWKKFKLCEIFEKIIVEKIDGKANDFPEKPTGDYVIPLLTAGAENQGLARYAMRSQCPTILSNVISVSANGANTGISFYQDKEFAVLQDAYAIRLKGMDIPSQEVGLFLASCLNKLLHGNFDWSNKAGWNNVKDLEISLPVTTAEVPDWDYMQERIAELEQERIAELEQYLVATGLNDYTLTDEDLKTLSVGPCKEMRAFRMGTIFEKKELKWRPDRVFNKSKDTSQVPTSEFSLPLVNAKHGDNGIMFYGRPDEWDSTDMTIDIVSNGAIATGDVYPQPQNTGVLWDAYLIKPVDGKMSVEVLMYLAGVIEKSIKLLYSYDNKAVWNKVQHDMIELPIQTDANGQPVIDPAKTYHPDGFVPDWDYMAAYIRAIEKLVVKDVVDFKDEFISKTRLAVAGKEAV